MRGGMGRIRGAKEKKLSWVGKKKILGDAWKEKKESREN